MRIAGQNRKAYTLVCVWCGCQFECSRPDAKCCKPSHRSRLSDYVRLYGHPPTQPLGIWVTPRHWQAKEQAFKEKNGAHRKPKRK